jgi:hypothetical protein
LKIFCTKIFVLNYFLYGRKSEKKAVFLLTKTPKPPESARQKQTHAKLVKSARNWESPRNIFCLPDDFQIGQNFPNLAEKTAIWQRWFNILPCRWQHVWLVAIVPPERRGKMDRNDCHTA